MPIYTVEMLRQVTMCGLGLQDFCEGFTIVARAPAAGRSGESETGIAEAGALADRSGA